MKVYYFGCINGPGRSLWEPEAKGVARLPKEFPLTGYNTLDAGLLPFNTEQVEGEAVLWQSRNWTILSFWDRSVDSRMGSNSAFVIEGRHDFEAAKEAAKAAFPNVWNRFKFEIRER